MMRSFSFRAIPLASLLLLGLLVAPMVVGQDDDSQQKFQEGQRLLEQGNFAEAAKALELGYQDANQFAPFRGIANYNLGCAYSLKGEKELSLESLTQAVDAGFLRPDYMRDDSDLNSVRDDARFAELLEKVEAKVKEKADKSKADGADKRDSDDN